MQSSNSNTPRVLLRPTAGDSSESRRASTLRDVLVAATALTTLTDSDDGGNGCNGSGSVQTQQPENRGSGLHEAPSCPTTAAGEKVISSRIDAHMDESSGLVAGADVTVKASEGGTNEERVEGGGGEKRSYQPTKTFPEKLMDMLSKEDITHAIAWNPDGKSFIIVSPKKLTEQVLPLFFKQAKFESFVRKLYRWGFRQAEKQDVGQMTFYHKHFRKGDLKLALSKLRSNTPSKSANMAAAAKNAMMGASLHGVGGCLQRSISLGLGNVSGSLGGFDLASALGGTATGCGTNFGLPNKMMDISSILAQTRGSALSALTGGYHPIFGTSVVGASAGATSALGPSIVPTRPRQGPLNPPTASTTTQVLNRILASDVTSTSCDGMPSSSLYQPNIQVEAAKRDLELQALLGSLASNRQPSPLDQVKSSLLGVQLAPQEVQPTYGNSIVRDAINALRNAS